MDLLNVCNNVNCLIGVSYSATRKDTKYCVSMWDEWVVARAKSTGTIIPYLKDISIPELNHWMCYFILEVRKKDGTEFPPNTLHHICCGILRYLRISGINVDIFKDKEFIKFRNEKATSIRVGNKAEES